MIQDNKFMTALLDVNNDLSVSWNEVMMYIYKNLGSILHACIVVLLSSAGPVPLDPHTAT